MGFDEVLMNKIVRKAVLKHLKEYLRLFTRTRMKGRSTTLAQRISWRGIILVAAHKLRELGS
jgi:hypothetical protein